jgi:hypothetical protein
MFEAGSAQRQSDDPSESDIMGVPQPVSAVLDAIRRKAPWALTNGRPSWIVTYAASSVVLIILFVVLFRHFLGLDALNYLSHFGIAAVLGLVGVIGLSVGLMAAIFYSSRSGLDDEIAEAHDVTASENEGTAVEHEHRQ